MLVLYILKSVYILRDIRDIIPNIIGDIGDVARFRVQKQTFVRVFGIIVRLIVLVMIVSHTVGAPLYSR